MKQSLFILALMIFASGCAHAKYDYVIHKPECIELGPDDLRCSKVEKLIQVQ